jgi:HSP20 family protein
VSVNRWDPFQDLQAFREEMNRTFNRWFGREEQEERPTPRWAPTLDVAESDDAYHIDVEVPGLKPEDIDVTIDQGMLTVKGERRSEEETRERQYHRIERRYGAFRRSITLPSHVDASRVEATYDNGVLRLTVPKTQAAQPKRITVQPRAEAIGQSQEVPVTATTTQGEPTATPTQPPSQAGGTSQAEGERPR